MKVIVLGAGVIGLTTSVRLLESGHDVEIWAREFPPHTTSNIAAAIWYPYKAYPEAAVRRWGRRTCEVLCRLAQEPGTGVRIAQGRKYFHRKMGNPWWKDFVPAFRRLPPESLPEGIVAGYAFEVPVADTTIYVSRYLVGRCRSLGARLHEREVKDVEEPLGRADIVVNCTGLGARTLVADASLYPIRGQVARVERLPTDDFFIDTDHPQGVTYCIPRLHDAILGGTSEKGEWGLDPDNDTTRAILDRCGKSVPAARGAKLIESVVGLRPGRPAVRLEREAGSRVIHNYGHGGSGITLSWGCAEEVIGIIS